MFVRVAAFIAFISLLGCSSTSADCSASVPSSCSTATSTSYTTDVAPLLSTYCASCHAAGGEQADKPLTSYAEVKRVVSDVEGEVGSCDMPPSDQTQPTAAERELILAWISCGASDD